MLAKATGYSANIVASYIRELEYRGVIKKVHILNLLFVCDEYRRNPQEEIRKLRWQEDDFKPYVHIIQGITELCNEHGEPVFDYCRATLAITFF